jgi:hypothetical protein
MPSKTRRDPGGRIARRSFLAGAGSLSGAGLIGAATPAQASVRWMNYTSRLSGASITFPASWTLDSHANTQPRLLYPHQSFVIHSARRPSRTTPAFPDLTSYPSSGIYMWLLHYDNLQDARDCPPFQSFDNYTQLSQGISEFPSFSRYNAGFSGSQRSFLLRLWVGATVSETSRSFLNRCVASLQVP